MIRHRHGIPLEVTSARVWRLIHISQIKGLRFTVNGTRISQKDLRSKLKLLARDVRLPISVWHGIQFSIIDLKEI